MAGRAGLVGILDRLDLMTTSWVRPISNPDEDGYLSFLYSLYRGVPDNSVEELVGVVMDYSANMMGIIGSESRLIEYVIMYIDYKDAGKKWYLFAGDTARLAAKGLIADSLLYEAEIPNKDAQDG